MSESQFTPQHHALLFAWIAQEVIQRAGAARGEAILRAGVRQYGRQRGGRMAQRARHAGEALSMLAYLAYGEWRAADPAAHQQEILSSSLDYTVHVLTCPWQRAWEEQGLLPYGRFYCLEIDNALAEGFNPFIISEKSSNLKSKYGRTSILFTRTTSASLNITGYL